MSEGGPAYPPEWRELYDPELLPDVGDTTGVSLQWQPTPLVDMARIAEAADALRFAIEAVGESKSRLVELVCPRRHRLARVYRVADDRLVYVAWFRETQVESPWWQDKPLTVSRPRSTKRIVTDFLERPSVVPSGVAGTAPWWASCTYCVHRVETNIDRIRSIAVGQSRRVVLQ